MSCFTSCSRKVEKGATFYTCFNLTAQSFSNIHISHQLFHSSQLNQTEPQTFGSQPLFSQSLLENLVYLIILLKYYFLEKMCTIRFLNFKMQFQKVVDTYSFKNLTQQLYKILRSCQDNQNILVSRLDPKNRCQMHLPKNVSTDSGFLACMSVTAWGWFRWSLLLLSHASLAGLWFRRIGFFCTYSFFSARN